ncbi:transcriptional regulator [Raoultella planticola]|uniref:Transcriptional regulator n=1 Tax=Raoultella planticola TaxID=575 RepID=A0A485CBP6_RAOPL|nr:transcriptional regulator [Raoultella planticola]
MSATAISNAVAGLEARLNVRLFNRTTRSVALTEAGPTLRRARGACAGRNSARIGRDCHSTGNADRHATHQCATRERCPCCSDCSIPPQALPGHASRHHHRIAADRYCRRRLRRRHPPGGVAAAGYDCRHADARCADAYRRCARIFCPAAAFRTARKICCIIRASGCVCHTADSITGAGAPATQADGERPAAYYPQRNGRHPLCGTRWPWTGPISRTGLSRKIWPAASSSA